MDTPSSPIRIDTRAGSVSLIVPLREKGLTVEEAFLPAGDVEIVGRGVKDEPVLVGVEYKTWSDLLQSMRNGRLADQLRKMRQGYQVRWLLVEGRVRQPGRTLEVWDKNRWFAVPGRFTYQEVTSRLATIAASGVQLWRTESQDESLRWLRAQYYWWTLNKWEDHSSLGDFFHPPYGEGTLLAEEPTYTHKIALDLPGLGPLKSKRAAERFSSPREMMNADSGTWQTVEGVGEVAAQKLVDVCTGKIAR